ncbi:MAG: WD40/YVTN/BNR-like repeat-containing protein, partial [Gammaproteobacteria bacterium]
MSDSVDTSFTFNAPPTRAADGLTNPPLNRGYLACLTLCLCLALTLSTPATAITWTQTSGPQGGQVNSIEQDSSGRLFAATGGGVFTRADDGVEWSAANRGLPSINIVQLVVLPGDHILVACASGANRVDLYRSEDGAQSWRLSGAGLPLEFAPRHLFAAAGGIIYSGGSTVYK